MQNTLKNHFSNIQCVQSLRKLVYGRQFIIETFFFCNTTSGKVFFSCYKKNPLVIQLYQRETPLRRKTKNTIGKQ